MSKDDTWVASWSCKKLISHDRISNAEPIDDHLIQISVNGIEQPVKVVTMSQNVVTKSDLPESTNSPEIEFVLNIPTDALVQRDALDFFANVPVGIGGIGDLYTAVNEKEFRAYIPKEVRFILRGLEQHTAVTSVARYNNRSYLISRRGLGQISVLALNEYDLTADAVRTGIEKYGKSDIILASNPNCRLSAQSIEAAKHSGARLLVWRQLLGALNN